MYTLISYPAGVVIEGVIVSRTRNRMRVVAAGMPDALELRRTGSDWFTENGEEIRFEFLGTPGFASADEVCSPAALASDAVAYRAGSAVS
jgi:hypothetical protein